MLSPMAEERRPKTDLPVATALPKNQAAKATATEKPVGRSLTIDPVALATGGAVALVGIGLLTVFLWMVPAAAARESVAACRGLGGYNEVVPQLCPDKNVPCALPVQAPDFTALDITGKQVHLSDFRGKVVLLNFWASWCGVCKSEKPSLTAMAQDLGSNDFVVLTLASDHNFGDSIGAVMQSLAPNAQQPPRDANGQIPMGALRESYEKALPDGIPFKVFLDPPNGDDNIGPITQSWGIKAVPESALIDRKGNIRAYFVNKRDWEQPVARTCLRSVIDE